MRFVFTFVREKVKFVREKSGKCQGFSRSPVCGNHEWGGGGGGRWGFLYKVLGKRSVQK